MFLEILMKLNLLFWGASGHALVVEDIIRLQGIYEIVGFLDDVNQEHYGMEFCGTELCNREIRLDSMSIKTILQGSYMKS